MGTLCVQGDLVGAGDTDRTRQQTASLGTLFYNTEATLNQVTSPNNAVLTSCDFCCEINKSQWEWKPWDRR